MSGRTAVVLGGSGLIGGHVLDVLLAQETHSHVRSVGRNPLTRRHAKLEHTVVNFDRLDETGEALAGDDVFCCLGTTISAAGSREAFRAVDHDYPLAAARIARERGAGHFLLVTALGADPGSRFFYNRVKGEVEQAIAALGYPSLHIFRPSLLLGDRPQFRPGERLAQFLGRGLSPAMAGPLRRYRPISAQRVAAAMVQAAAARQPGTHIIESDAMA